MFEKIVHSKAYNDLLKTKFYYIRQNLVENNFIIKLIGSLTVSKYIETNSFEEFKKTNEVYGKEIEPNTEQIANEILNFFKVI